MWARAHASCRGWIFFGGHSEPMDNMNREVADGSEMESVWLKLGLGGTVGTRGGWERRIRFES